MTATMEAADGAVIKAHTERTAVYGQKVLAEKLGILQDMAAKQENFLELTAVLDCLRDVQVTPEELEEVYSRLERKGIRVGTPEGTRNWSRSWI